MTHCGDVIQNSSYSVPAVDFLKYKHRTLHLRVTPTTNMYHRRAAFITKDNASLLNCFIPTKPNCDVIIHIGNKVRPVSISGKILVEFAIFKTPHENSAFFYNSHRQRREVWVVRQRLEELTKLKHSQYWHPPDQSCGKGSLSWSLSDR